jgi:hypothetical protein
MGSTEIRKAYPTHSLFKTSVLTLDFLEVGWGPWSVMV